MQITVQTTGGSADEPDELARALRDTEGLPRTVARVAPAAVTPGTLGVTADVVQCVLEQVAVPLFTSALFEYLKNRWQRRDGRDLRLTVTVRHPDGGEPLKLTVEGTPEAVAAAIERYLS